MNFNHGGCRLFPIAFHPTQDPISSADVCHSIGTGNGRGCATAAVAMRESGQGYWMQDDIAGTLRAEGEDRPSRPSHVVGVPLVAVGTDCFNGDITGDVAATMGTRGSSQNASGPTVMQSMQVRRLTPTECERLQGFPDGYTAIPWRGKTASECPDGPRYKALGNSWAVPVVRWIGRRINERIGNA
jgi:DNA (cytosine-5)-methyltransferase 1